MNEFLPDEYKVPGTDGGYMKFVQGDNKIRILSRPIIGWEWWVDKDGEVRPKGAQPQTGDKPMRARMNGTVPVTAGDTVKHFWAMVVWNYQQEAVQILQITQKSIQNVIKNYSSDPDWGSPLNYDLVINKTGEKLDTEYQVLAKPAKPLDSKITEAYKQTNITLEALYDGANPFGTSTVNIPSEDIDDDELPI